MGGGAAQARGRGRRPCGWAGTAPSLLSESDSDPLLAPARSGSASCSFGSWRLGWLFTSPPGLRPGRRGAGVCVPAPFPPPSTGVGEEEVGWVLGSGCIVCGTSRLSQVLPSTDTAGYQACCTDDQVMCYLHRRLS